MYLYMQRLLQNPNVGFDCDYMGSAEYEFGATKTGRLALARLAKDEKLLKKPMWISEDKGKPIEVIAYSHAEFFAENEKIHFENLKESMRLDKSNILGWMAVHWDKISVPLLLVRPTQTAAAKMFIDSAKVWL